MKVVIAEKPSVARDIAAFLRAESRQDGYFAGGGYQVTWAFGHLAELKMPEDYRPEWKHWSLDDLPIIPAKFAVKLTSDRRAGLQFAVIKRLLSSSFALLGGCSRAGSSGLSRMRTGLLLDENGVRVPMGVFGLQAKHLTRNGRHEEAYHILRFPPTTFRCLRARVHRSLDRRHLESHRSGTIFFPDQRSPPPAPTSSSGDWNESLGNWLA